MTELSLPRSLRLGDLLDDWQADVLLAHDAYKTGVPRGPITRFPTLDRELGGCLVPGLHLLHGQPGCGKSAFALQVAATCGCPALFITCEMPALELLRRLTAGFTRTPLGRLKTGELPLHIALDLAQRAVRACPDLRIADATTAYAAPDAIRRMAEEARGDHKHVLVVVDSVHAWADGAPSAATEYEALNGALYHLLDVANRLNAPVLGVVERNRASMATGGQNAGAGTRKLEYKSWTMLELQLRAGEADAAGEIGVDMKISKNRSGRPNGGVSLLFNGALQSFREAGPLGL